MLHTGCLANTSGLVVIVKSQARAMSRLQATPVTALARNRGSLVVNSSLSIRRAQASGFGEQGAFALADILLLCSGKVILPPRRLYVRTPHASFHPAIETDSSPPFFRLSHGISGCILYEFQTVLGYVTFCRISIHR